MDTTMIITFSMLAIILFASAIVTASVMCNIDKIGDLKEIKAEAVAKALFNFYAIAVLSVIVVIRFLNLIEPQRFIALLVVVLGGLGFKLAIDLKHRS